MGIIDETPGDGGSAGKTYSCAELSRIIGRHPNTLRKYETWGFISGVPRAANGYRVYSRTHALEALLAVTAFRTCFQEWEGRRRMKRLIAFSVSSDFAGARDLLAEHRSNLGEWLARATEAKKILDGWKRKSAGRTACEKQSLPARKLAPERVIDGVLRGEAAKRVGVAVDTLRDWERNSLVTPARLANGRRMYSKEDIEKLLVIRSLRQSGYSLMGLVNLFGGKTAIEDLTFARDRWDETLWGLIEDGALMEEILDGLEHARTGPSGQDRQE